MRLLYTGTAPAAYRHLGGVAPGDSVEVEDAEYAAALIATGNFHPEPQATPNPPAPRAAKREE